MWTRLRDSIMTTGGTDCCRCITCRKIKPFDQIQAGHGIGGRNDSILLEEKLVHGQCTYCNRHLGGNYAIYRKRIIEMYGKEEEERLWIQSLQTKKFTIGELLWKIEYYKGKIKDIKAELKE